MSLRIFWGNPPFVGKDKRTPEQTADMEFCCSDVPNFKTLGLCLCLVYQTQAKFLSGEASPLDVRKSYAFRQSPLASGGSAAERRHSFEEGGQNDGEAELRRTSSGKAAEIRVAFVSTNSITQGEQVGVLWQYLFSK